MVGTAAVVAALIWSIRLDRLERYCRERLWWDLDSFVFEASVDEQLGWEERVAYALEELDATLAAPAPRS